MESKSTETDFYQKFFDPKLYVDLLLSGEDEIEETLTFSLEQISKAFTSGAVKGRTLIDIGTGPIITELLSASDVFSEIIVTDYTDRNLQELEKWWKRDPQAFDISSHLQLICKLEGNSQPWMEREEKLRRAVTKVLKCDITQSNPLAPIVLDPADCILSAFCLESVSSDEKTFHLYLKNMTSLLRPGGHLVLLILLGCSFYMVGEHKFPTFFTTDGFVRSALTDIGFAIEEFNLLPHSVDIVYPQTDHGSVLCVVARKGSEDQSPCLNVY